MLAILEIFITKIVHKFIGNITKNGNFHHMTYNWWKSLDFQCHQCLKLKTRMKTSISSKA